MFCVLMRLRFSAQSTLPDNLCTARLADRSVLCSKFDGRVEDEGTRTGMHMWQGISGVRVSTATIFWECRLLTSGVWVSTATEGTK